MIAGFLVLVVLYMAYRLNRDEGIIVLLEERVNNLETNSGVMTNVVDKEYGRSDGLSGRDNGGLRSNVADESKD